MNELLKSVLNPPPVIWPLFALLAALCVLSQIRQDLKPITRAMVDGVAKNAARNSMMYFMAVLLGAAASLQALADVSAQFGWWYVVAFAKVVQPGTVAVIGLLMKSPITVEKPESSDSRPPMPTP